MKNTVLYLHSFANLLFSIVLNKFPCGFIYLARRQCLSISCRYKVGWCGTRDRWIRYPSIYSVNSEMSFSDFRQLCTVKLESFSWQSFLQFLLISWKHGCNIEIYEDFWLQLIFRKYHYSIRRWLQDILYTKIIRYFFSENLSLKYAVLRSLHFIRQIKSLEKYKTRVWEITKNRLDKKSACNRNKLSPGNKGRRLAAKHIFCLINYGGAAQRL